MRLLAILAMLLLGACTSEQLAVSRTFAEQSIEARRQQNNLELEVTRSAMCGSSHRAVAERFLTLRERESFDIICGVPPAR